METIRREWAEALALGGAVFTERFGHAVEAGWWGFPEALQALVDRARADEPDQWGAHLFFDEDGALVGVGGWRVDPSTEPPNSVTPLHLPAGAAVSPPRRCANWCAVLVKPAL